jgi:DNA-binding NarL/FixJ family response regulator
MIRERLRDVIEGESDLMVCGEASDRFEAIALAERCSPDLVLVDLTLRDSHGLDLIKDLQVRQPGLPILVVSMHDESLHAERVLRAGARGYITKQEATTKVLLAIRAVLAGKVYLSENLVVRLATRIGGRAPDAEGLPAERLTDQEMRVFEMIGQGYGTRQIAEKMRLHMSTIETYRARIKTKLDLADANELRRRAIHWVRGGAGS